MSATLRPTALEPVNEISAARGSATSSSATWLSSGMKSVKTPSNPISRMAWLLRCCSASAVSGTLGLGFHTTVLPPMAARKPFCAHTAAGKL